MRSFKATSYKGEVFAPSSKSYLQRAIAIALLAKSPTRLTNVSWCNDTRAALNIAKELGAQIKEGDRTVLIQANPFPDKELHINCGESGLGIRMFSPIAALHPKRVVISGEGSLKTRPVDMVEEALTAFGLEIKTNKGFLPIEIKGPLSGGEISIDGSLSSQLLTGLLIALPMAKSDSVIHVNNLTSRPYVDMTLEIISDFGIQLENSNYEVFSIKGKASYSNEEYNIEGDWSGAAFHLVGAAISGTVQLKNLSIQSKQADVAIMKALELVGSKIEIGGDFVKVSHQELKPFEFDANQCPDLFPPLVVLAAACNGVSKIKGVNRLKHKESDRALVLKNEFKKLGLQIDLEEDEMKIYGTGKLNGGKISSNNDHRIAMAAAIASLLSSNEVKISNPDAINKSYPSFYEDFDKISS